MSGQIQIPGWQLSILVGGGTFFGVSLYNRFTQDPEEINSNTYLLKASAISSIAVLIISCVLSQKGMTKPSENILTQFQ